jgi:hypothetical protein
MGVDAEAPHLAERTRGGWGLGAQNYKASAESEESRRRRLQATPHNKAAKEKEQAESLAFYRKQRGLE